MDMSKFFEETNFEDLEKRVAESADERDAKQSQELLDDDGDCDGCKI